MISFIIDLLRLSKEHTKDLLALLRAYRRGLTMFCALAFLGGIPLGLAVMKLSSSSSACGVCHYMKPYVAAWKESKHSGVPCAECHYPDDFRGLVREKLSGLATVVRYLTNTYDNAPRAEIDDANCLRQGCHDKRLLSGVATYKRNIRFDHQEHLKRVRRDKQLRCTTCHSQIVQGEHISVTKSVCFICHFKEVVPGNGLADCKLCHDAPKTEVEHEGVTFIHTEYLKSGVACLDCHTQTIRGDGKVPKRRCSACHTEPDKKRYDSKFIHNTHVTEHKVECFECHNEIEHGKIAFVDSLETPCNSCHSNRHNSAKEMFMGIGAKGVADCPDPMFVAQVVCDACHGDDPGESLALPPDALRRQHTPSPSPDNQHPSSRSPGFFQRGAERSEAAGLSSSLAKEAKPDAKASNCVACHGRGYDAVLASQRWAFDEYVKRIEPVYERARGLLSQSPSWSNGRPPNQEWNHATAARLTVENAKQLFERASHNYNFVKRGRGVHNVLYAKRILLKVQEDLNESISLLSPDYAKDDVLGISENDLRPGCTQRCHPGVERIDLIRWNDGPRDDPRGEVAPVHSVYAKERGLSCTDCHDCSEAPRDPRHGGVRCDPCHGIQKAVLAGEWSNDRILDLPLRLVSCSTSGVPEPGPHAARLDCRACHSSFKHAIKYGEEKDDMIVQARHDSRAEIEDACDGCHSEGMGNMTLDLWQRQIKGPYERTLSSLAGLQVKLALLSKDNTLPSADMDRAISLIKSAEEKLDLVREDGSWGAHNLELIHLILAEAGELVTECEALTAQMLASRKVAKGVGYEDDHYKGRPLEFAHGDITGTQGSEERPQGVKE